MSIMKNIAAMLLLSIALACNPWNPLRETVIEDAFVYENSIRVIVTDDRPAYVIVEFEIGLSGCESFHSTDFLWEGNTCVVDVKMSYPTGGAAFDCPDIYEVYEGAVCIGKVAVERYQVRVNNNLVKEFEIAENDETTKEKNEE